MRLRFVILPILIILIPLLFPKQKDKKLKLKAEYSVAKVLEKFGDKSGWYPDVNIEGASSTIGRDIVTTGFATNLNGKKQRKQSKHFVCTSCHNIEREDPDLAVSDPDARLQYVTQKGIPFLPGTTLYGAVSRRTFYNDDYVYKYGELVEPARNDLRGAIQLCAVECAQGRELKDWELESILMYLWTIDIKIKDLNLTNDEIAQMEQSYNDEEYETGLKILKSKYFTGSPATFVGPQNEREAYATDTKDIHNGKLVFVESCMHCHEDARYSYFDLDTNKISMKFLKSKIGTYEHQSIYQAIRYGVHSVSGRKSYMPKYPLERMSEQQLSDLRAYIEAEAE